MPRNRVDWQAIRLDYIGNSAATYLSLAERYGVPERTLRWHAKREHWREERDRHCRKVADKLTAETARAAEVTIQELNDAHLKRSGQMRALLEHKLVARGPDGRVVPRESLSIADIAKAVVAFGELYRLDRIALGAHADSGRPSWHSSQYDRLRDMSDAELEEELKRVRGMSTMV